MVKQMFEAIEGLFRGVIYILILCMGVVIAALAAYTILFLALRTAAFLWVVLFQESWI